MAQPALQFEDRYRKEDDELVLRNHERKKNNLNFNAQDEEEANSQKEETGEGYGKQKVDSKSGKVRASNAIHIVDEAQSNGCDRNNGFNKVAKRESSSNNANNKASASNNSENTTQHSSKQGNQIHQPQQQLGQLDRQSQQKQAILIETRSGQESKDEEQNIKQHKHKEEQKQQSQQDKVVEACLFCQKYSQQRSFCPLLNRALYSKYASSQNYFYSKDVNDILSGTVSKMVVQFRDVECMDQEEEFLNRFYTFAKLPRKMKDLAEYYKYQKEIPRLFMLSMGNLVQIYHDKRRRIEYKKIKKQLNLEGEEDDDETEVNTEEEEEESEEENKPNNNNSHHKQDHNHHNNNKKSSHKKKKVVPKECEFVLENLDVSLSFHKRMQNQPVPKLNGSILQRRIVNTDINPFYFYMNNKGSQSISKSCKTDQFDSSSLALKPSNKNFKPQQQKLLPQNFNYDYSKAQVNSEASYSLSSLIQGSNVMNQNERYSTELSLSKLNAILFTHESFQDDQQHHQQSQMNMSNLNDTKTGEQKGLLVSQQQGQLLNFSKNKNAQQDQLHFDNKPLGQKQQQQAERIPKPQQGVTSSSGSSNFSAISQKSSSLHQPQQQLQQQLQQQQGIGINVQAMKQYPQQQGQVLQQVHTEFNQQQKQSQQNVANKQLFTQQIPSMKLSSLILEQQQKTALLNQAQQKIQSTPLTNMNNNININNNNINLIQNSNANSLARLAEQAKQLSLNVHNNQQQLQINSNANSNNLMALNNLGYQQFGNNSNNNSINPITYNPQNIQSQNQILQQNKQTKHSLHEQIYPNKQIDESPQESPNIPQTKELHQQQQSKLLDQLKASTNRNSGSSISQKILQKRGSEQQYQQQIQMGYTASQNNQLTNYQKLINQNQLKEAATERDRTSSPSILPFSQLQLQQQQQQQQQQFLSDSHQVLSSLQGQSLLNSNSTVNSNNNTVRPRSSLHQSQSQSRGNSGGTTPVGKDPINTWTHNNNQASTKTLQKQASSNLKVPSQLEDTHSALQSLLVSPTNHNSHRHTLSQPQKDQGTAGGNASGGSSLASSYGEVRIKKRKEAIIVNNNGTNSNNNTNNNNSNNNNSNSNNYSNNNNNNYTIPNNSNNAQNSQNISNHQTLRASNPSSQSLAASQSSSARSSKQTNPQPIQLSHKKKPSQFDVLGHRASQCALQMPQQQSTQINPPAPTQQAPVGSSCSTSQTAFFYAKRSSANNQMNLDLAKTQQFYKTPNSSSFLQSNSKNRSSSNPKQPRPAFSNNQHPFNNLNSNNFAGQSGNLNSNVVINVNNNFNGSVNNNYTAQQNSAYHTHGNSQGNYYNGSQPGSNNNSVSNNSNVSSSTQFLQQQQLLAFQYPQGVQVKHQNFVGSNSIEGNGNLQQLLRDSQLQNEKISLGKTLSQQNTSQLAKQGSHTQPRQGQSLSSHVSSASAQNQISHNKVPSQNSYKNAQNELNNNITNNIVCNIVQIQQLGSPVATIDPVEPQTNIIGQPRTRSQEIIPHGSSIPGSVTARPHHEHSNSATGQISQRSTALSPEYHYSLNQQHQSGQVLRPQQQNIQGAQQLLSQFQGQINKQEQIQSELPPQSVKSTKEKNLSSMHFADSMKKLIENSAVSSGSVVPSRASSISSLQQQLLSSKQQQLNIQQYAGNQQIHPQQNHLTSSQSSSNPNSNNINYSNNNSNYSNNNTNNYQNYANQMQNSNSAAQPSSPLIRKSSNINNLQAASSVSLTARQRNQNNNIPNNFVKSNNNTLLNGYDCLATAGTLDSTGTNNNNSQQPHSQNSNNLHQQNIQLSQFQASNNSQTSRPSLASNQHLMPSLSRNNSPSKLSRQINPTPQTLQQQDNAQNNFYPSNSSRMQSGTIQSPPINSQQSLASGRAASSLRGTTKASSLIRFRQSQ